MKLSRRTLLAQAPLACGITASTQAAVGSKAPLFRLRSVPGTHWQGVFDLGKALEKGPVVVSYFATWCRPCEVELPVLQKHHKQLASKGLTFVAVAIDGPESAAQIAPMARRLGLEFPVVHDADSRLSSRQNPRRLVPFLVAINPQGIVIAEKDGWTPEHAQALPALFDSLLMQATSDK